MIAHMKSSKLDRSGREIYLYQERTSLELELDIRETAMLSN